MKGLTEMKTYRINEVFHSVQGEGYWTGTSMTFVRFSGCNKHCWFCDTSHEAALEMTPEEILASINNHRPKSDTWWRNRLCLTGGEPCMQVDEALARFLCDHGCYLHVETNGTYPSPFVNNLVVRESTWVTLSPKYPDDVTTLPIASVRHPDEVKIVIPLTVLDTVEDGLALIDDKAGTQHVDEWIERTMRAVYNHYGVQHCYIQPCYYDNPVLRNLSIAKTMRLFEKNTGRGWRLSFQMHKALGIK